MMTDDPARTTAHTRRFDSAPSAIARAPGRVNLIGEHIDYSGGVVLPLPVDLFAWVSVSANAHPGLIRAHALDLDEMSEQTLDAYMAAEPRPGDWANYVLGTIAALSDLLPGDRLATHGIDLTLRCDIPAGAGLSSSAAIEVATARAIAALMGIELDPLEIARRCQQAEHTYARVPCGLMDQAVSSMATRGKLLAFDCLDETGQIIDRPADLSLILIDSGVRHALNDSAYGERRGAAERASQMLGVSNLRALLDENMPDRVGSLPEPERAAAMHGLDEMRRVNAAIDCLRAGDLAGLGQLLSQSHASLRDTLMVSCTEIDTIVDIAQHTPGVLGARLTGAGFGGCVLLLATTDRASGIAESVIARCPDDVRASLVLIDSGS